MKARYVILTSLVVLGLLVGACVWAFHRLNKEVVGTFLTQNNFKSDKERIAFVQSFLPVKIPLGATAFEFKYDSWMEYDLRGTFHLSGDQLTSFVSALDASAARKETAASQTATTSASSSPSVPDVTTGKDGSYGFYIDDRSSDGKMYRSGTITVDKSSDTVKFDCQGR